MSTELMPVDASTSLKVSGILNRCTHEPQMFSYSPTAKEKKNEPRGLVSANREV